MDIHAISGGKLPGAFPNGSLTSTFSVVLLALVLINNVAGHAGQQGQGEARVLFDEGFQLYHEGSKESLAAAIRKFEQALQLYRATGDRSGEATTVHSIGRVYSDLGEKQKALSYYDRVLPLWRAVGDRRGEAATLNNMGRVYDDLGEKQKALSYYADALPLLRAVGERGGEGVTLNNIGRVYDDLGEKQKALSYYDQALPLRRAVGDRRGEATTLSNIGLVYSGSGEKQKALNFYTQSLPIFRAEGDRRGEAETLNNIGAIYDFLGQKQKALDYYSQALPLRQAVGDRDGEATTLNNLGHLYNDLGERQKALAFYTRALPLFRAIGERSNEADTLGNIALLERDRGNLIEARHRIEDALALIEGLRNKYTNKQLGASYFATVQVYYQFYIDLLMRLHQQRPMGGFDGEALQVSERARARTLLDTLREAGADIRQGVDVKLLERERFLQHQLEAKESTQTILLSQEHSSDQAEAARKEIESLIVQYQEVEARIRSESPRYAALTQPEPLTVKEIQQRVLDADTLLLEYSLGADQSYLWVVSTNSIAAYRLAKRVEIEDAARQVYATFTRAAEWTAGMRGLGLAPSETPQKQPTLGAAKSAPLEAAVRLSKLVLSPVTGQLGKKRLIIVADGALQFIPFGALPNLDALQAGGAYQPLTLDHEVVSLPSASTLAVLRREVKDRQPAAKWLAVLADPIFDSNDERLRNGPGKHGLVNSEPAQVQRAGLDREQVTRVAKESGVLLNGLSIPRLPGTRREAEAIMSLVPSGQGSESLDLAASRQTVASGELGHYRYLHFATHGFLDSEQPELSGIVLSMVDANGQPQDGFLRSHEIFNLKLPAEMVVLSACETGLGKDVKGEGLLGLTRGFMYAGAPRVVVSLWSVNDAATAELMTRFYRGILRDKLRPAQALQAAQVSMWKDARYSAPFYWAAFTLQGEWR